MTAHGPNLGFCLCKQSFTGTQLYSFVHKLSMATFLGHRVVRNSCNRDRMAPKPKISTMWLFTEKSVPILRLDCPPMASVIVIESKWREREFPGRREGDSSPAISRILKQRLFFKV